MSLIPYDICTNLTNIYVYLDIMLLSHQDLIYCQTWSSLRLSLQVIQESQKKPWVMPHLQPVAQTSNLASIQVWILNLQWYEIIFQFNPRFLGVFDYSYCDHLF